MSEQRIRVVGGPWPERIGLEGHIVTDPGDGIYPFSKRGKNEVVIRLDDDPFSGDRWWSCACYLDDIELLAPDRSVE